MMQAERPFCVYIREFFFYLYISKPKYFVNAEIEEILSLTHNWSKNRNIKIKTGS